MGKEGKPSLEEEACEQEKEEPGPWREGVIHRPTHPTARSKAAHLVKARCGLGRQGWTWWQAGCWGDLLTRKEPWAGSRPVQANYAGR